MEVGLVLLAIVLIIVGIVLYRRYKNRPQTEEEEFVPKEAADVVALRKLEELNGKKLWQNEKVKDYYVDLSFIVREYISNRYQMHALEHTTDEIMSLANQSLELDDSLKKKLHQMLMLADMAKFAKQEPMPAENEEAFKHAMFFIEETKIEEKENKIEKESESEEESENGSEENNKEAKS
jgi:predicted RND superfamily exporter protein